MDIENINDPEFVKKKNKIKIEFIAKLVIITILFLVLIACCGIILLISYNSGGYHSQHHYAVGGIGFLWGYYAAVKWLVGIKRRQEKELCEKLNDIDEFRNEPRIVECEND